MIFLSAALQNFQFFNGFKLYLADNNYGFNKAG